MISKDNFTFTKILQLPNWVIISKLKLFCHLFTLLCCELPILTLRPSSFDKLPPSHWSVCCSTAHTMYPWPEIMATLDQITIAPRCTGPATGAKSPPVNVGRHQPGPAQSLMALVVVRNWGTEPSEWLSVRTVSGWQLSSPVPAPVTQGSWGPGPIVTGVSHDDRHSVTGCW